LRREEEELRSVAVLRELQRMVRDRLRVECQRRPAEVKEMVRAVRQEERRAAVLRLRVARRRMLVRRLPERREPRREVMTMERPRAQSPRKERPRMGRLLEKRRLERRLLERREQQEERRGRVRNRMPHRQQ
jgi:hypothetical protein